NRGVGPPTAGRAEAHPYRGRAEARPYRADVRNCLHHAILELLERFAAWRSNRHKVGIPVCESPTIFAPDVVPRSIFPKTKIHFPPNRIKNRGDMKPAGNPIGKEPATFQVA